MTQVINKFFEKPVFNNKFMNYKLWKDVTVKKLLVLLLIIF